MAFWKLYYHLVWGTKNRRPFIAPIVEAQLYPLLVERAAEIGVFVYVVNGWWDHVHLVAAIPPKLAISDVIKDLKGASSHFINTRKLLDDRFQWQRGYGVFSLGEKQRPFAEAYVNNQKKHHEEQTTNAWLEHMSETDEGIVLPTKDGVLRESGLVYEVGDDFPF